MSNHADSPGFIVRISLRANPDDQVVIKKSRGRWPRWTVDQIYHSWLPDDRLKRGRQVFEASMELGVDGRCAPLFLLLSRALKIIVFFRREW
jgi:hypothetical protein